MPFFLKALALLSVCASVWVRVRGRWQKVTGSTIIPLRLADRKPVKAAPPLFPMSENLIYFHWFTITHQTIVNSKEIQPCDCSTLPAVLRYFGCQRRRVNLTYRLPLPLQRLHCTLTRDKQCKAVGLNQPHLCRLVSCTCLLKQVLDCLFDKPQTNLIKLLSPKLNRGFNLQKSAFCRLQLVESRVRRRK